MLKYKNWRRSAEDSNAWGGGLKRPRPRLDCSAIEEEEEEEGEGGGGGEEEEEEEEEVVVVVVVVVIVVVIVNMRKMKAPQKCSLKRSRCQESIH